MMNEGDAMSPEIYKNPTPRDKTNPEVLDFYFYMTTFAQYMIQ